MILHVTDVKYLEEYRVEVTFNDGKKGNVDLKRSLRGTMFNPLKDKKKFAQLKVDNELGTIIWPNGADLAPEYIYFEAFKDTLELQDQFREWGYIS